MVELKAISKTYNQGKPNQFQALREISLGIELNRVTVFKGPSGSGKTTLLSIIGCMTRPTSGRITLGGREITSLPERFLTQIRRRTFGFIFQKFNLLRGLTVQENIMLPAYPEGLPFAGLKEKAAALMQRFNIADKAGLAVELLSGGEQQRVAMARALINDPAVIIPDEPTAHLDRQLSLRFLDLIAEMKAEQKTILMASHDPLIFEADVVDRVIELRDGRIVAPC